MPWPKGKPKDHLRKWTPEQEEYVRQNYDGNGSKLEKVIPFSSAAIRNKAKRLGVKNAGYFHNVKKIEPLWGKSSHDLHYIAGFFDGEGSIYPDQGNIRVSVANSNREVIEWIFNIVHIGKIRTNKARKSQHLDSHVLSIQRIGEVWGFLEQMIPYLRVKKQKAIEAVKFFEDRYTDKSSMISGG